MENNLSLDLIKKYEGFRSKPYKCTAGKLTIGYGRNLDDVGITPDEAEAMIRNDYRKVLKELDQFEWYHRLNAVRKCVIENMVFNLGLPRFLKFKKTIAAIKAENYAVAADEMISSRWASQVKGRALQLAEMMKTGSHESV